eukprot:6963501-Heterocapsa_arctica.AAC.1
MAREATDERVHGGHVVDEREVAPVGESVGPHVLRDQDREELRLADDLPLPVAPPRVHDRHVDNAGEELEGAVERVEEDRSHSDVREVVPLRRGVREDDDRRGAAARDGRGADPSRSRMAK